MIRKTHMSRSGLIRSAIYAMFLLSGISGLVYETVWLRMLIRILGSTAYAMSVVLASFMGGMALGSFLIGRYAARVKNQLRLYAILELGAGVSALLLTLGIAHLAPLYRVVYDLAGGERIPLTAFQSVLMFLLLLLPTCLMGGTLPVLSAHTRAYHAGLATRVGSLYGLNTLGAVLGVLGSGLYTLGAWGETQTLLVAVGLTLAVSLMAWVLSQKVAKEPVAAGPVPKKKAPPEEVAGLPAYSPQTRRLVGIAYALSGFAALSYEVVWTRMFQIQVGTSIYSFSIMLAFYLAGVALGSLVGARLLGKVRNPIRLFGLAQLGIAVYSIFGMYLSTLFDPVSLSMSLNLHHVLVMPLLIVFPITFVLGLIFPAVCRSYVRDESEVSLAVGRLYALNTLGCIAGSLLCGFVLLWLLGTRNTLLAVSGLNVLIGIGILFYVSEGAKKAVLYAVAGGAAALALVLTLLAPDPFRAAVSRSIEMSFGAYANRVEVYYHKESVAATTTAMGIDDFWQSKHLWVNGIGMTVLCTETKVMAHLPLLMTRDPKDMLVVCFGMGTTLRSASLHKELQIDVVELVPEVFDCFRYFHANGPAILADPRIHAYADDGRNFLLMRPKRYDVITIDPAPPVWAAGTVNLYTREFFQTCKDRLKPGGVLCLWVPPVEATEVLMIVKTFNEVFPDMYAWRGLTPPVTGFFLTGTPEPHPIDPAPFRAANANAALVADLTEWDKSLPVPEAMLGLLLLRPEHVARFVGDARVITDDHPYTEFPLWRSRYDPAYQTRIQWSPPPPG
jgi:spermidine synthase